MNSNRLTSMEEPGDERMDSNSIWTIDAVLIAIIFITIGIPLWIIWGPFYVIIKTIVTIWQPYFYKKKLDKWEQACQESLKGDEVPDIEDPPSYGTFWGIGPWFKKKLDKREQMCQESIWDGRVINFEDP